MNHTHIQFLLEYVYVPPLNSSLEDTCFKKKRILITLLSRIQKYGFLKLNSHFLPLKSSFGSDPLFINHAISYNPKILEFASTLIRDNFHIILKAVQISGKSLWFASDNLKNNKKIVHAALFNDKYAFVHAGNTIKNDLDFILSHKYSSYMLKYISSHSIPTSLIPTLLEINCPLNLALRLIANPTFLQNNFQFMKLFIQKQGYLAFKLLGSNLISDTSLYPVLKNICKKSHFNT